MPQISHPVFGSVGRTERPEASEQPQAATEPVAPAEEPSMAPSDLQTLIDCGKVTDTIVIDGQKFRMSTLADDVQEDIIRKFSAPMTDAGNFVELRRTVVASALETFNDKPLEQICRGLGQEEVDRFGMKLAVVRIMQGQVVDKLYAFYEELLKRSRQKVDPEQVKN